jgi:hypothetical protein
MDNDAAPAQGSASSATDEPYQSLAELRDAHLDLKRFVAELSSECQGVATERIRAFLVRARKTGAFLRASKERRPAQVILDYWSAELAARPEAEGSDFESVMLDKFERDPSAPPSEAAPANKEEQREFLRLSQLARQWQEQQQQEGYLLAGDAIPQAKKFAGRDPNLDKFIAASEEGVRREAEAAQRAKRRARKILFYTSVGAVIVTIIFIFCAGIAGFLLWQKYFLPGTTQELISGLRAIPAADAPQTPEAEKAQREAEKAQREASVKNLRRLSIYQPWSPPYDLSTAQRFADIELPGLTLNAPSFTGVRFTNVKFPHATMQGASFSKSQIEGSNDFTGAQLTFSQFRLAKIESTSFVGATLYRAVFDRAILCGADFSEADLREASFWAVSLDEGTHIGLRNTAWWLATGWGSEDVHELLDRGKGSPAKPLIETIGFRKEMERIQKALFETTPNTFERALVLHDLAWTLAIWGITASPQQSSASCQADGNYPKNALDAVDRAICIAVDQKKDEDRLSFQDTKAYILMQNGRMAEAAAIYDKPEMKGQLDGGEVSFRAALAQYAVAREEAARQRAARLFEQVLRNYVPSHELKHLRQYIPPELWPAVDKALDDTWPSIKAGSCP